MMLSNDITYSSVWNKLNAIEVDTDKKGKFDYLSWTEAWTILMDNFPFATYSFSPETYEGNGTVMTHCSVSIGHLERSMWLPVMDSKGNSIPNPSTRQIQDSRMRCLVKCLAMYGLGHYVYRGEDLPDANKDASEYEAVRDKFDHEFKKQGGHIIGANDPDEFINVIAPHLKMPNNVLNKELYVENKDAIDAAQKLADGEVLDRYLKLRSLYENEEESNDDS